VKNRISRWRPWRFGSCSPLSWNSFRATSLG